MIHVDELAPFIAVAQIFFLPVQLNLEPTDFFVAPRGQYVVILFSMFVGLAEKLRQTVGSDLLPLGHQAGVDTLLQRSRARESEPLNFTCRQYCGQCEYFSGSR